MTTPGNMYVKLNLQMIGTGFSTYQNHTLVFSTFNNLKSIIWQRNNLERRDELIIKNKGLVAVFRVWTNSCLNFQRDCEKIKSYLSYNLCE